MKITNRSFCMTLWLPVMHHHTQDGNKLFGSLENICTFTDILTVTVTLTLNAVIFFTRHSYDDVPSDQLWLPKNQQFRGYSRKSNILNIEIFAVTMTLNISNKVFHMTPAHDAAATDQAWLHVLWFRRYLYKHSLIF